MSYVRAIRAALPGMRERGGGAIVNVSSTAGKRPSTGMPNYSVTKAAVLSLSRLVADLYAKDGIRCNAVTPGPTATEAWLGEGGLADQQASAAARPRRGARGGRRRPAARPARRAGGDRRRDRLPLLRPRALRDRRRLERRRRHRPDHHLSRSDAPQLRWRRCRSSPDGRRRLRGAACASTRSSGSRRSPCARTRRAGAQRPEERVPLRTPFQRDRDRIVHSKAFRRLQAQDAGLRRPRGRPLPHAADAHARDDRDRARRRARAAAERGPHRGDRPRPRPRPPAVRPRRRGGARRAAARARRRAASATTSTRCASSSVLERDGRGLNLTREVRDGILTHTGPDEPETLEGKIVRLVDRVAYINHDIDDAIRAGILDPADLPPSRDRAARRRRARGASTRSSTTSSRPRRRRATSSRATRSAGDALAARVHVRARLPRPARAAEHARARATIRRIFDAPRRRARRRRSSEATDYLAGMTDRFALAYAAELG